MDSFFSSSRKLIPLKLIAIDRLWAPVNPAARHPGTILNDSMKFGRNEGFSV